MSILLAFQVKQSTAEAMDAKALSSAVAKFSAKFCNVSLTVNYSLFGKASEPEHNLFVSVFEWFRSVQYQ